jgi:hypothetical protein
MVSRLFRRIGAVVLSGMTMVFCGGLVVLRGLLVMLGQFGCVHCDLLLLGGRTACNRITHQADDGDPDALVTQS